MNTHTSLLEMKCVLFDSVPKTLGYLGGKRSLLCRNVHVKNKANLPLF